MSREISIQDGFLRFHSIRESDQGDYRCVAQNIAGDTHKKFSIYVRRGHPQPPPPPPSQLIEVIPPQYIGNDGDTVRLTCRFRSEASTHEELHWTKIGYPLPNNAYIDRGMLVIQNAQRHDTGSYSCSYGPSVVTVNVVIEPHGGGGRQ